MHLNIPIDSQPLAIGIFYMVSLFQLIRLKNTPETVMNKLNGIIFINIEKKDKQI